MEPESSGGRTADQLQGSVIQDKTVQPDSAGESIKKESGGARVVYSEKVVIRTPYRLIKGYLETPKWENVEDLLRNVPRKPFEVFRVQLLDTGVVEDIPAKDAKAMFYVKTFEGDDRHNELKFHARAPIVHGIWVKIEFEDNEVMEGIVQNSIHYLVEPGFFLLPTDPRSNNKLVYVIKNSLRDCRVLGVRNI